MSVQIVPQQAQANVPEIVESASFTGKNAALAATTIYTPQADGLYRLDYYVSASATGVGAVTPQVLFTDDFGAETVSLNATQSGFGSSNAQCAGGSFTFKAKAGQNIQVATTVGAGTAPTYNFYATLVQL